MREGLLAPGEVTLSTAELNPFAPEAWVNVALGYLTTGRPDSTIAPARRSRQLQPGYSAAPFYEALAHLELGRPEEAVSLLRELELGWAPHAPPATEVLARLAAGDSVPARRLLDSLPEERDALFYRGLLHGALEMRAPSTGPSDGSRDGPPVPAPRLADRLAPVPVSGGAGAAPG